MRSRLEAGRKDDFVHVNRSLSLNKKRFLHVRQFDMLGINVDRVK